MKEKEFYTVVEIEENGARVMAHCSTIELAREFVMNVVSALGENPIEEEFEGDNVKISPSQICTDVTYRILSHSRDGFLSHIGNSYLYIKICKNKMYV